MKHFYELMADDPDESSGFEPIMILISNNQLPDLVYDILFELVCFSVIVVFIWAIVATTELYEIEGSHCHLLTSRGCPRKAFV